MHINSNLKKIKKTGHLIPVDDYEGNQVATLKPIVILDDVDDVIITQITKWRNRAKTFFATQFTATTEGTENWIKKQVISSIKKMIK